MSSRLCTEIESNVKKLEAWNAELKQMVVNLVEELNGGTEIGQLSVLDSFTRSGATRKGGVYCTNN